jgi:hypothetical protein
MNQSAFVPGRLITDNALVAFECFHYIQQEKDPEKSFCAYKLDLSKAYDRVDWRFLGQTMIKMGFDRRWVKWIMTCVTTVKYQVKFNGAILDSFAPSRGLRQGDPLSPFLFLFVADGLSALLRRGMEQQSITPIRICPRAPGVSHLLFADDTLLFFKATVHEAEQVKEIVEEYGRATGQLINHSKCSTLFSRGCPATLQEEIRSTLQVEKPQFEAKYLGLPTVVGRSKDGAFKHITERSWGKVHGWKGQGLSMEGKETLIKSVL